LLYQNKEPAWREGVRKKKQGRNRGEDKKKSEKQQQPLVFFKERYVLSGGRECKGEKGEGNGKKGGRTRSQSSFSFFNHSEETERGKKTQWGGVRKGGEGKKGKGEIDV